MEDQILGVIWSGLGNCLPFNLPTVSGHFDQLKYMLPAKVLVVCLVGWTGITALSSAIVNRYSE